MEKKCIISTIAFLSISVSGLANLNLALNKPATASQFDTEGSLGKGGQPFHAADGDYVTEWNAGDHGTLSDPEWLIIDLEAFFSIQQINLWDETDNNLIGWTNEYKLYSSLNMTDWELLGSGILYDSSYPYNEYIFNAKKMRYVKYEVVGGTHWAHLCELEVFGEPIPEPATLTLLTFGGLLIRKRK